MARPVVMTAMCKCPFGTVPVSLPVSSQSTVMTGGQLQATIMDNKCPPFGMCSNPANPAVAAATAAAMGVLTPSACIPALVAPWAPGAPTVLVCGKPLLNDSSKLMCAYGGVIEVSFTPVMNVKVP